MNKIQLSFLKQVIANAKKLNDEEFEFVMDLSENKDTPLTKEQNSKLNQLQKRVSQ